MSFFTNNVDESNTGNSSKGLSKKLKSLSMGRKFLSKKVSDSDLKYATSENTSNIADINEMLKEPVEDLNLDSVDKKDEDESHMNSSSKAKDNSTSNIFSMASFMRVFNSSNSSSDNVAPLEIKPENSETSPVLKPESPQKSLKRFPSENNQSSNRSTASPALIKGSPASFKQFNKFRSDSDASFLSFNDASSRKIFT